MKHSFQNKQKKYWNIPENKMDDDIQIDELEDIMLNGVAHLDCGCIVEPDGTCPCGNQSPLLDLGMI